MAFRITGLIATSSVTLIAAWAADYHMYLSYDNGRNCYQRHAHDQGHTCYEHYGCCTVLTYYTVLYAVYLFKGCNND